MLKRISVKKIDFCNVQFMTILRIANCTQGKINRESQKEQLLGLCK